MVRFPLFIVILLLTSFHLATSAHASPTGGPKGPGPECPVIFEDLEVIPLPEAEYTDFDSVLSAIKHSQDEDAEKKGLDLVLAHQERWLQATVGRELSEKEQAYKFLLEMNIDEFSELLAVNAGSFKVLYRERPAPAKQAIFPSWALIKLLPAGLSGARALHQEMKNIETLKNAGLPTTEFIPWTDEQGLVLKKFNQNYYPFVFVKWHNDAVLLDSKARVDDQTINSILTGTVASTNEAQAFYANQSKFVSAKSTEIDFEIGEKLLNLIDQIVTYKDTIVDIQILVDVKSKEVVLIDPLELITPRQLKDINDPLFNRSLRQSMGWLMELKRRIEVKMYGLSGRHKFSAIPELEESSF